MSPSAIRSRFLWRLNNTLNRLTSRMARTGRGPFSLSSSTTAANTGSTSSHDEQARYDDSGWVRS